MASLSLGSDVLVATPSAGQKEFNGTIFTGAPTSTTRGIIPTEQFYALNAGLTGANVFATPQNILGVGVTLAGSTQYEFELMFTLAKSAGTTSHTISLGFGGTATINSIIAQIVYPTAGTSTSTPPTGTPSNIGVIVSATASAFGSAITSAAASAIYIIKGTVSINAGGTFIPQYTLSAAPGGAYTTQAGSYMKIKPIGVSGANVSVGTWA